MSFSNTHFSVSVHVLTILAIVPGEVRTSVEIADGLDTNPAFVRQVMAKLREAGFVATKLGVGGGSYLDRDPAEISLADVFRATEGEASVSPHCCPSDGRCPISTGMPIVLNELSARVDQVIMDELAVTTVADLAGRFQVG